MRFRLRWASATQRIGNRGTQLGAPVACVGDRALGDDVGSDADNAISFAVVVPGVFDDTTVWGATGTGSYVRRSAPSRAGLIRSSSPCLRGRLTGLEGKQAPTRNCPGALDETLPGQVAGCALSRKLKSILNGGWDMKAMISAVTSVLLAAGLAGCGSGGEDQPAESTTSTTVSASTPSSSSTTTSSSTFTSQSGSVPSSSTVQANPTTDPAAAVPVRPPFMSPEDFDPYGPPRFVQCWESNAAVMSDGSIVTDTVNCGRPAPGSAHEAEYVDPPRADGCVGPAATCGYYDEDGNPIWFDKETGQTSPRYLDENGNPTMDPN